MSSGAVSSPGRPDTVGPTIAVYRNVADRPGRAVVPSEDLLLTARRA